MQGFYFALLQYSHIQAFPAAFLPSMQFIPPQHQKRLQGFTVAFPLIRPIPAHTIQQTHKPPIHRLRHAGGHTVKCCTSTNTRYHRHAGRCTGATCPPTIIMYIRVQRCAPVVDLCQAVQQIADRASPAGSASPPVQSQPGGFQSGTGSAVRACRVGLAHSTRRGSPAAGVRRAARNH